MAAGVTGEALVAAIAEMEAAQPKDAAAERRRAWDRERKRKAKDAANSTGIPLESAESAETSSLPLPPNEYISNPPTPTHPDRDTPPARKAARFPSAFPCPAWADEPVWADLLKNRKAKRLPNTATAHRKFVQAVEVMADEAWPPGRLLEAIVARGWAGAYDPRENRNDRPVQSSQSASGYRASAARPADNRDGFTRALDDLAFGPGGSPH